MVLGLRSEGRTRSASTMESETTAYKIGSRSAKIKMHFDSSTARGCRKELSQNDAVCNTWSLLGSLCSVVRFLQATAVTFPLQLKNRSTEHLFVAQSFWVVFLFFCACTHRGTMHVIVLSEPCYTLCNVEVPSVIPCPDPTHLNARTHETFLFRRQGLVFLSQRGASSQSIRKLVFTFICVRLCFCLLVITCH